MNKFLLYFYYVFLFLFLVFSYLFVDPGLIYLRFLFTNFFPYHRLMFTTIYVSFIIITFIYYILFLREIKKGSMSLKSFWKHVLVTAVILLFSYPALVSFDIFNYIATAKVTFFYHENPYIVMPIAFSGDPLLLFMHAANKTALYAPLWILLTGIPFLLGFHVFLLTLFNFKLFVLLWYVATVWLLLKMNKSILKTAVFALNPLVLFETLVSGHNDIVMMFLFLFSVYLLFKSKTGKSTLLLFLSGAIKYATLILSPLYILSIKKHISQEKFFFYATLGMYIIFFLSAFREEIYPWYALWFLLPSSFLFGKNLLTVISLTFSFSLLLRYVPFMLLGTYFGPTPLIKLLVTFVPVLAASTYYLLQKRRA